MKKLYLLLLVFTTFAFCKAQTPTVTKSGSNTTIVTSGSNINTNGSTVIVNGKAYSGKNVVVNNNTVTIDGKTVNQQITNQTTGKEIKMLWTSLGKNFCPNCIGIGLYYKIEPYGKAYCTTCNKTCKGFLYTIKFENQTGKVIYPSGVIYVRNFNQSPVCDMSDDQKGNKFDFASGMLTLNPGDTKQISYILHIDTTKSNFPPIPNNNSSSFSYKIKEELEDVGEYKDTICGDCKGKECLTYILSFKKTGIGSLYSAYMRLDVPGEVRAMLSGIIIDYKHRIDGSGTYSKDKSIEFKWSSNDDLPEMKPQYIGDIFMDSSPFTGKYNYNKKNVVITGNHMNCLLGNTSEKKKDIDNALSNNGTFTDSRDGHTYKWVKIGDQIWMAENLDYVMSNSICYGYHTTLMDCNKYGQLYIWKDAKKACPVGWHLPSKDEISILLNNFNGKETYYQLINGGKSGFNSLPGGTGVGVKKNFFRFHLPMDDGQGYEMETAYWSSSIDNSLHRSPCGSYLEIACETSSDDDKMVSSLSIYKETVNIISFCSPCDWLYVRCIKDKTSNNSPINEN
ncbi:MAG: FISUMP domain-containing protein [Bacteroidales bacterium]